ncbi:MAG: chromosomal replication initiator protein DnaA [Tepidisphaeraceae bacterium]
MRLIAVDDRNLVRLTEVIQQRVGHQRYQVWFSNSTRFDLKHDALEIAVPNDFISEWIGTHFKRTIQEAAHEVMGCTLPLRFSVMPQLFDATARTAPAKTGATLGRTAGRSAQRENYVAGALPREASIDFTLPRMLDDGMPIAQLAPATPMVARELTARRLLPEVRTGDSTAKSTGFRHDLDTFIVGPSNQLAYNAAVYVAEFPGAQYNPLFIHGNCGLGKTHLLQGLCKKFIQHHPSKKWMYLTGEEFTNEFLLALRHNRVDAFRRKMRELDLLVIDDVHFLSGKKATQEEFLHTFNAIEAMGRQVVLASDEHPKLIAEFGESLINRFVSGMVVRIDAPNCAMRGQLLRAMSLKNKINLSEEVIQWVARRVTQNVRELEGAITRISAHTRLTGRPADVMLAQESLGDLDRQLVAPVKPESVLSSVCTYFGLEMKDLMSGRRQRTISLARSVAMYLVRKTSKLSFPEIAGKMGKRNHSTVISACRRIERAAAKNEKLAWSSHLGEREEEAGELLQRLEEQARSCS